MNENIEFRDVQYPVDDAKPRPETREPVFGAVSPSMPWPAVVTRPRAEIIAGFETQELRLRTDGRLLAFARSETGGAFPFAHPVIVVSTSIHSYDAPAAQAGPVVEAVAISADRQWVDRMLIMCESAAALRTAARLGGRFALRWDEFGVAVLDLVSGEQVSRFPVSGRQLTHRCCPLIPDAQPGDLCKQHGGPWVSRSITAASHWNDRRRLYWDLVGCDEGCAQPRERSGVSVPTRYDMWLGREDLAQPERHNEGHCRVCSRLNGEHRMGPGRAQPSPGVVTVITPDAGSQALPLDEPVILSKGMILEVGVADTEVWPALARLLINPAGGGEDPLDWSEPPLHWRTTDADLRSRCKGLRFLPRWAAIGPLRVTGVQMAEQVVPFVFDLRNSGSGLLLQRTWLRVGSYRIGEVGTRRICVNEGRDTGRVEVLRASGWQIDLTIEWILREDLEALVALGLEPYDPAGHEVHFDRRRHLEHRDAAVGEAEFHIDTAELRRRLRGSTQYRRVRAALELPSSAPEVFYQLQAYVKGPATGEPFRLR